MPPSGWRAAPRASGTLTGTRLTFTYDSSTGRLTQVTDNLGRSVTYGHDSFGNLATVTGPGISASYTYATPDGLHRLTSIEEGRGEYQNIYDAKGRVIRQTHANGVIAIEYLVPNQKVKVTTTAKDAGDNVLGTQVRIVEFSDKGMVVKNTDTFGHVTNYIRDPQSSKITREEYYENTGSVDTPNLEFKSATDYTYDAKGNMLTKTEAAGSSIEKTTTWTYHPTFSKTATETAKSVVNPAQNKVVDNLTRESLAIEVDKHIGGQRVVEVLMQLGKDRGLPKTIRVDNGPEFISKRLDQWAYLNVVELDFSRGGKPTDNGLIEAFNGRLRQECLNESWFLSLDDARDKVESWRKYL